MSRYPTINYIGNKHNITDWIIECLPIKKGKVLDLFCGGCSVSYALKEHGYCVIANDALFSNYILAKAIIENNKDTLDISDISVPINSDTISQVRNDIDFLSNNIYFDYEVDELAKLICVSQQLKEYKNYMFLSLLRRAMIRKIPYSRMNVKWEEIQKLRDEEYSYKKYGRYRHYHNVPFFEHIQTNLDEYNNAVFDNTHRCKALHLDAFSCIESLNEKVDIIYMDPPYPSTMNKYTDFYGAFDKMLGIKSEMVTDLTDKKTFLDNFYKLIEKASLKTKYIVISLNNKSYPSYELLSQKIEPIFSKIFIFTKEHTYKVTGKGNKHSNFEILMLCKVKKEKVHEEKSNN